MESADDLRDYFMPRILGRAAPRAELGTKAELLPGGRAVAAKPTQAAKPLRTQAYLRLCGPCLH
jgi:hypothetical protein